MGGGGGAAHVDADLADDRFRGTPVDPRDGHQAVAGLSERGDEPVDLLRQPLDGGVQGVEVLEDLRHQQGVVGVEAPGEGRAQLGDLPAQGPLGQLGKGLGIPATGDQGGDMARPEAPRGSEATEDSFTPAS